MTELTAPIFYWIDHTVSCATNTGVQRVVRGLASGLLSKGRKVQFVCWDTQFQSFTRASRGDMEHLARWNGPRVDLKEFPEERTLLSRDHLNGAWLIVPEVTHLTPHPSQPTAHLIKRAAESGMRTCFIFYDAIPLKLDFYLEVRAIHKQYMEELAGADLIIPISRFSGMDIADFLKKFRQQEGWGAKPQHIVPCLLPSEFSDQNRVTQWNDPKSDVIRILSVGSIEHRKNQVLLIDAFLDLKRDLPHVPMELSLVGNLHPDLSPKVMGAVHHSGAVHYLGYLDDAEVNNLYAKAHFTVFPSIEEGFGLPILESLYHGRPCMCAEFGSMAEVAEGGGCLTVDTRSKDSLKEGLRKLVTQPELRRRLGQEAVNRPMENWEDYANKILGELEHPRYKTNHYYYYLDSAHVYERNTGIQRVVRSLARGLQEAGHKLTFVKWNAEKGGFCYLTAEEGLHLSRWNGPEAPVQHGEAENDMAWGWLLTAELISAPHHPIQVILNRAKGLNMRVGVVFYDAIPWKMKDIYPREAQEAHANYMMQMAQADLIFPISHHSRTDLLAFYYQKMPKISQVDRQVVACPLPGEFPERPRNHKLKASRGKNPVTILCVGTVEPRKNHLTLAQAFIAAKKQSKQPLRLVVVGGPFAGYSERFAKAIAGHPEIEWLQKVDDAKLQELYETCDFTIYPSLEEGFGLPILESIWNARPSICRNSGSMAEVAEGGGCMMVETADANAMTTAMVKLANEPDVLDRLNHEAVHRTLTRWTDYAEEIAQHCQALDRQRYDVGMSRQGLTPPYMDPLYRTPLLSLCISTYNHAKHIRSVLRNTLDACKHFQDVVEVFVCDNASKDNTREVVASFSEPNLRYHCNAQNVGILGNLRETARLARGRYVWIIGDDDLIFDGTVERVLEAVLRHPDVAMLYLNYGYTSTKLCGEPDQDIALIQSSQPICPSTPDRYVQRLGEVAALNENMFTAIYACIFRKDHAVGAYSQDTSGPLFSSMLTCVPTTYYVAHYMLDEPAYWFGSPMLMVNMNCSWLEHALAFVLERTPEVHELFEQYGVNGDHIDVLRERSIGNLMHHLNILMQQPGKAQDIGFCFERMIRRHKHISHFQGNLPIVLQHYQEALKRDILPKNALSPAELVEKYGLPK